MRPVIIKHFSMIAATLALSAFMAHGQGSLSISTPGQITDYPVTSIDLSGSSSNLVGSLTWSNALTGFSGPATGLSTWSATGVTLNVGVNTIQVWGTNDLGAEYSATVIIKRLSKIIPQLTVFYDFEGDFNDMPGAGVTNDDLDTVTGGSLTSDVPASAKGSSLSYTFNNTVEYQTAQSDAWSPDIASADAYTIMFWFKGDNALQNDDNIRLVTVRFQEGGLDAADPVFQVEGFGQASGDNMDTRLSDPLAGLWFSPDANGVIDNDANPDNDVWHHVVFTLSNRGGPDNYAYSQAYVDGVKKGLSYVTTSTGNPIGNQNGELILGGQVNIGRSAVGSMDDFALYEGVVDSNVIYNIAMGNLSPADPVALQIEPAVLSLNGSTLDFTVNFSMPVSNFNNATDLVVTHNGTTNTGVTITGSNAAYVVTLTGLSGQGTLRLAVNTNSDVTSLSSIPLAYSVQSAAVALDGISPAVTFIQLSGVNPSSATSTTFNVMFNELVTNFNGLADLLVAHSGTTNTGAIITGGGSNYTVQLTSVSGSGTFTLAVSTNSDVMDLSGNALTGMVVSAVVTQFIDSVSPYVVSIVQTTAGEPHLTITFSEAVSGFNHNDVILDGLNFSTLTPHSSFGTSNIIYQVFINDVVSDGISNGSFTAVVDLNGGVVDLAGNPLTTPNPTSGVMVISAERYQLWAIGQGLQANANFSSYDDPDGDGRNNGVEYMHDGNPLVAYDTFKERVHVVTNAGEVYVVLTIAAPDDAEYYDYDVDYWEAGYYEDTIALYDTIVSSTDLTEGFGYGNAAFVEDLSVPTPSGMPSLSSGFSYRHFRFTDPIGTLPKAFFQILTVED